MKTTILLVTFLVLSIVGVSQNHNQDTISNMKYGFNLGTNYSFLCDNESLPNVAKTYNGFGVSLGVFLDYRLNENLAISPKTELSFHSCSVEIWHDYNLFSTYKIFPSTIDFMTHLKYKL